MKKRTVKIGAYDTAAHGWTLAGCKLADPELKEIFVEKTGGDGSWNLTSAMTGGIPRYKNRPLAIRLECSIGTREDREALINELVNDYDGFEWQIVLPDRPDHYVFGQVRVAVEYSDLSHAAVNVTATCEPWLYQDRESVVELTAAATAQTAVIRNSGRRAVVPVITTTGSVQLRYGIFTTTIDTAGAYEWSPLLLTPGLHELEYSGDGILTVTFREAVLR